MSVTADVLPVDRRVIDWDVEPARFDEYVTLGTMGPLLRAVRFSSDDGFASADPLTAWSSLGASGFFSDVGPDDRGGFFEFGFPRLGPGEAKIFYLYYGAAPDEASSLGALAAVGAQVYSLGQPNVPGGSDQGIPNTFMFGFRDPTEPPGGPLAPVGPTSDEPTTDGCPYGEVVPGANR
jgi:hypothetical protein